MKTKLNPFPWLKRHAWQFVTIFAVGLCAYLFYLDTQIQAAFSGNKWQVPAQIYARPLQLFPTLEINPSEVVEELELLGYRRAAKPNMSGEYSRSSDKLHIQRRAFAFAQGEEPERLLEIRFANGRIAEIKDLKRRRKINSIRLEPLLVTRLVSSSREDRMLVSLEDVPEALIQALITVEDKGFYQHYGVDPIAIARALVANIAAGKTVQGGSTLTQQLVKNLFLSREQTIQRKIKEALMSLIIEFRYSKDDILEAYLNEVFLGQNGKLAVHGFGLASQYYFGRPLNELDIPAMATLVGMVKGPSLYNPKRNPEGVQNRRNLVLRLLFDQAYISAEEYQAWVTRPISSDLQRNFYASKHPAFMQQVRRELQQLLADPAIRESGIRVFTTLDYNAQQKAEKALVETTNTLSKARSIEALQGAMVITDIDTGEVRALVGDTNVEYQGFNRALDARRSIGSVFKPVVYLTALQQSHEYNLASLLSDQPIQLKSSYGKQWQPQNADKKFRGEVALVDALSQSLNVPTVTLGMQLGLDQIAYTASLLGVQQSLPIVPAMTLGAVELSPLEVNQLYQTLANAGRYVPLHTVQAVTSSDNQLFWQFSQSPQQRIDEGASYLLNYALHKVTREGTAKLLKQRFPDINMAGKTGTTDEYRDSWFSGFDKNHLITTWLGKDDNQPTGLTGASGALQVFANYQAKQQPKSLVRRFPDGLGIAHFDTNTGLAKQAGCPNTVSVPAVLADLPRDIQGCKEIKLPEKKSPKKWWERLWSS